MCGIFFYCGYAVIRSNYKVILEKAFSKIKHRGPDESKVQYLNHNTMMGFHRLAITDPQHSGMQPFSNSRYVVTVNGEIYNYKQLYESINKDFSYSVQSHSDCEVILHLWSEITHNVATPTNEHLKILCDMLDGEFAFIIYEPQTDRTYIGVDEISCRPMFIGTSSSGVYIASEQKALIELHSNIHTEIFRFPGGHTGIIDPHDGICIGSRYKFSIEPYFKFDINTWPADGNLKDYSETMIHDLLVANVERKLRCDREKGFLLSGGFDSSIICGIASKLSFDRIRTFTIGFSTDSPDVIAARKVSRYINSIHTEIIVSYQDGIDLVADVIYADESWDQTTIRASTPMALLVKAIKNDPTSHIAVLFSGEVADELFQGYLYNFNSPNLIEGRKDQLMRLEQLPYYDGLRADRVTAYFGSMELRLPFFGKDLFNFVLSRPVQMTDPQSNNHIEKYILRKAFEGKGYIPDEIIWRTKNAFSDATSPLINGESEWKSMLKQAAAIHVTPSRANSANVIYDYKPPKTVEDMWYREEFDTCGYFEKTIPGMWMPSWVGDNATDSSATTLNIFKERTDKDGI